MRRFFIVPDLSQRYGISFVPRNRSDRAFTEILYGENPFKTYSDFIAPEHPGGTLPVDYKKLVSCVLQE